MASFLQYKTNGIQWAVWKMEESLDALLLLLPGARRAFCEQELNRFVSERRKMEWLSVRVLLYSMLQEDKEIVTLPRGNLISQIILLLSVFLIRKVMWQ